METIKFKLDGDFITLVNLLKYENVISSGGEIKLLLENDLILYNGNIENRKRKKCYLGDEIIVNNEVKLIII